MSDLVGRVGLPGLFHSRCIALQYRIVSIVGNLLVLQLDLVEVVGHRELLFDGSQLQIGHEVLVLESLGKVLDVLCNVYGV